MTSVLGAALRIFFNPYTCQFVKKHALLSENF